MKKKWLWILPLIGLSACCMRVITDEEMTLAAIGETSVRMGMYLRQQHKYPATLAELPERPGYANRITDGWKRPLIYNVDMNGIVTIMSLGRDGKPGGAGKDQDVSRRYRTKNPDGSWCVDDESWIVKDEIK